jgi:antitoxin HicB
MNERYAYPIDLATGDDGRVTARFPDLPGAATDGVDRQDALAEAADCLEEAIAGRMERREPIPPPSVIKGCPIVSPGALISAKAALYTAMRAKMMSNSALARTLGCAEGEIRRMLDPRHATKISRLETALAALGKRLVVEVLAD